VTQQTPEIEQTVEAESEHGENVTAEKEPEPEIKTTAVEQPKPGTSLYICSIYCKFYELHRSFINFTINIAECRASHSSSDFLLVVRFRNGTQWR
jgi:hypothetical protein